MKKFFKKKINEEFKKLLIDAECFPLTDWEVCQALKTLTDSWEREVDNEMFLTAKNLKNEEGIIYEKRKNRKI